MDPFFYLVIAAGALAGAGTGLLGVTIVGMRMPFIGISISHAAMAGSIYAVLLGIEPTWGAVAFSLMISLSLAAWSPDTLQLDNNVALAIINSFMMGLIFLGIGLVGDSRTEVLGLLWGSLLFVRLRTVLLIGLMSALLVVFMALFDKELKAVLFSRSVAAAAGIHERLVYGIFLGLCGLILSVNLQAIGGLLIFCLMINPAAAAYQVCRGYRSVLITACLLGAFSAVAGFLISFYADVPTGACIVLVSTALFAAAAGLKIILNR